MPLSTRIAPHLPYLRRYSRSLLGTQFLGDAKVTAVLEALIADVTLFGEGSSDRVRLFRLFSTLFSSVKVNVSSKPSPFTWEQRATANLSIMPTVTRQAFLLANVEGFSLAEVGEILNLSQDEVEEHVARAKTDIDMLVTSKIMIIEDEPLIAMDLESLVEDMGHQVTGIARTYDEALALFEKDQPSLVLADIQLADGSSGIDAANEILKAVTIPVIFITAFPERLLTGEKPEPAFLITKPFQPQMVMGLISQALFFSSRDDGNS